MFCPRCGQLQQSEFVRFCSGCRFVLTGLDRVIREGGLRNQMNDDDEIVSPKVLGLKQGGLMILSGILIVPLLGALSAFLNIEPFLAAGAAIFLFLGGFLRLVYALIFQPHRPTRREDAGLVESVRQIFVGGKKKYPELHEPRTSTDDFVPASVNWRDTADLHYTERDRRR